MEVLSGAKSELEWKRLSKLFPRELCLEADQQIAESASIIRYQQRLNNRKLKTPDAIIIATAMQYELILVSRASGSLDKTIRIWNLYGKLSPIPCHFSLKCRANLRGY
jgi:hypothetical protein